MNADIIRTFAVGSIIFWAGEIHRVQKSNGTSVWLAGVKIPAAEMHNIHWQA